MKRPVCASCAAGRTMLRSRVGSSPAAIDDAAAKIVKLIHFDVNRIRTTATSMLRTDRTSLLDYDLPAMQHLPEFVGRGLQSGRRGTDSTVGHDFCGGQLGLAA